ncbi:site-specific integrase [Luxibacter massiliensis]|uniref:site-specific integrase n=1 Tax=Luxibacter massiliensis TaxID=2219695 RepID=UPI000F051124|nr:site-specific integrase [Luxibacter massiliensis]
MEQMMFEEWAEEWLDYKKNYVKESTYANYLIAMVNHIVPAFQGMEMNEITTNVIQNAVLAWSKTGCLNKTGGLSLKTIKDMTIIVKMCIKDYEERYDSDLKIRTIEYPAIKKSEGKAVLSKKQQEYMLNVIKRNLEYETLGYAVSLYTGIRIGELCALQWGDIDIDNRLIRINKTLQRIYLKSDSTKGKTKVTITSPKSDKAVRDIPISQTLYSLFKKLTFKNKKVYLLTGDRNYIEPRLYRKHYEKFLREHNIEQIRFHGLRHTFATRCIESGADYKIVSELLGHSSVNLTLNLYVHPHMEDKRRCVELI